MEPSKRKMHLCTRDKISILDDLEKGLSARELAIQHGVSINVIYSIKRKRHDLEAAAASCGDASFDKKSLKTTKHGKLEEALLVWLRQERNLGEPVNGPLLCKKAMVFNEKLGEYLNFKASHGWLHNFKRRRGIRLNSDIKDEKLSANAQPSENFTNTFKAYIEASHYDADNIYNADESGLNWRSLPKRVSSLCEERSPSRRKDEDRVTATFCANASGKHRIPVFVTGKQKQSTRFENIADLPVTYKARTSVWMDHSVFLDWYQNNFIPLVKSRQATEGRQGKVLLLLDNAPSHPPESVLNAIDGNFKVIYLPLNVSEKIQPMDQGIIETAKKFYRQNLMRNLLSNESGVEEFLKNFNLNDCCELLADAWKNVASSTLARAWKAFIPFDESDTEKSIRNCVENVDASDLVDTLNLALGSNIHERELENWMIEDTNDNGWEIMNDDEILASVVTGQQVLTKNEDCSSTVFVNVESDISSVTTGQQVPTENKNYSNSVFVKLETDIENSYEMLDTKYIPNAVDHLSYSAQEAVQALNVAYSWLDQQSECSTHDLAALNRIRDLAMSKSMSE